MKPVSDFLSDLHKELAWQREVLVAWEVKMAKWLLSEKRARGEPVGDFIYSRRRSPADGILQSGIIGKVSLIDSAEKWNTIC